MKIQGIIPALLTPFDENKEINLTALEQQIERLIEQGVGGFYACGSTAECFLLSEDERKQLLECVVKKVDGRVPVIAHIGQIGTQHAINLALHAKECGATAISSVPPFYFKFSFDELVGYYKAISDAVNLPMIVYNFPAFSGVSINANNMGDILGNVPNIIGLKYTSNDLYELEKIKRRYPELNCYNGYDEIYCSALPTGVVGAIGSTFNVMAPKFIAITRLYEQGRNQEAAALQGEVNYIIETIVSMGNVMAPLKYLLTKHGNDFGGAREPFAPLSEENKARLDSIYELVFSEPTI